MSSHIMIKLVFKGVSHEPLSKLTCPFSSGTEGSTTRSSKMTPSFGCSNDILSSFTLSTQKSRIMTCSKSKYASLASSSMKGLYAIPASPDTYWNDFSLPKVKYSVGSLEFFQLIPDSL